MKLRIYKNSIRLRINRNDLNELNSKNILIEALETTIHQWSFRIILDESFRIEFNNDGFIFFIPKSDFNDFRTEQIDALKYQVDNLILLIEKEYACLHPVEKESESDSNSLFFSRPTKESD